MDGRRKVAVMVAAHCAPKVLKLTLGSWLECYDGSYDAMVYMGLHRNYGHYHPGVAEMMALDGKVGLTLVDEIEWRMPKEKVYDHVMRFSKMHSKSLIALIDRARREHDDFTHIAFLDNDLVFRSDFVGWAAGVEADVVTALFEDRVVDRPVVMYVGGTVPWAPKPSIWHMVVSRRMFDCVARWPFLVEPCMRHGRMFDTMALAFEFAKRWGMKMCIIKEDAAREMVKHVGSMSLNYGPLQDEESKETYNVKLAALEAEYDRRFPNGIDGLWNKLPGKWHSESRGG